ncbi:MAG TPA: glycoside hydrolase family 3 C-terminal domain-containing protein [Chthoniobacterales bacterium]
MILLFGRLLCSGYWPACLLLWFASCPGAKAGPGPGPEERARQLAAQMTLGEKADYLGGVRSMYIRGIPRLGIPEIKMSDGPLGVRQDEASTRYPAGAALAASWNPELARAEGVAMGRDCRARGVHILLAPGLNLHRIPVNGRNFEYLSGEDPFLAARMVVPFIEGVQSQGVMATAKHFAVNNQEFNRMSISAGVDERTLRELYLPAFEAAVKEAHVGAVMDAYNRLNGVFCTENAWLDRRMLREEWGFRGILMSDWSATHSVIPAFRNGIDLEMPSGEHFDQAHLVPLLRSGKLSVRQLNEKIVRVLSSLIRMGFFERPQRDASIPERDPASERTALAVAREGVVLLKNTAGTLPLDPARVRSVAVLGPAAHPGVPTGGGSSYVNPPHAVSVCDGLRAALGPGAKVDAFGVGAGSFGTSRFVCLDDRQQLVPGLRGEYFDNDEFRGPPAQVRTDAHVDFAWNDNGPFPHRLVSAFSIRWTGFFVPAQDGQHLLRARSDDAMRVYLDGQLVINDWEDHGSHTASQIQTLQAGRRYALKVEYRNRAGGAVAQFALAPIDVPAEVATYDAAVLCVGFSNATEGEGSDRTFDLPDNQDDLIAKVEKLNPRTVVVLFSGGAANAQPWIADAPAFLEAWYPGQEGGTAIAEILTGQVNPSGRLPISFDRNATDNPAMRNYPSSDHGSHVAYREGVYVGYRGYDQSRTEPLYPFGYGLSYTKFSYADLTVNRVPAGPAWEVSCRVTNSGEHAGSEVVQLYVTPPGREVDRPPKELKAFAKVTLEPDQQQTVTLMVKDQDLCFYDIKRHAWRLEPGRYLLRVGHSSRDLPVQAEIQEPIISQ